MVERIAVVLFRRTDDKLVMLDKNGVEIGPAERRADHPELPVIRGPGAQDRVGEVIALLGGAPGIVPGCALSSAWASGAGILNWTAA